jgi:hypothetical protein
MKKRTSQQTPLILSLVLLVVLMACQSQPAAPTPVSPSTAHLYTLPAKLVLNPLLTPPYISL